MNPESRHFIPDRKVMRGLSLLALSGAVIAIAGVILVPERMWPNILLASYYLLGLGLGGSVFIAFVTIANAGWATAIRRVPEAISVNIIPASLLMVLTLFGSHTLYEWTHESAVASDALLQAKSGWLNMPFFSGRTVAYLFLWGWLTWLMVRTSRKQDLTGDIRLTEKNRKYAGIFVVVMALTFWMASMDWIMTIEPHWYSTIFGIYHFSGLFLTGLAAITIIVILLRRAGVLRGIVHDDHLQDLGKLIFAFSTFWMYIWFSQYMLIWYSNIPEETSYFIRRETAGWGTFMVLNLLFNWVIPFIFLISRAAKRNEGLLLKVCVAVLIGHWIDLFWMILPPFMPDAPQVGIWEVGPVAGIIAIFFLVTFTAFSKARAVPEKDPLLAESLHYHS